MVRKVWNLFAGVRAGSGFGGGLFGLRGDAEAHEEETKAFAEGIDETHGVAFPETHSGYRVGEGVRLRFLIFWDGSHSSERTVAPF
jgi:hypothetical protein